ncbi:MAG TPA: DUF6569 family protein [Pyrinomonadaceae bacterium]|nr:DUF6569 family protein [Pyrinomonadaceae bacterium]
MQTLTQLLDSITIGPPQTLNGVRVFPLLSDKSESRAFLELDEALEKQLAEVTEVSDSGSVPQLIVINHSQQDIIIFDGEQLIGAKQNRIVNITVIVPANSTLPIPVSCVEQGRWHYSSPTFAAADACAYPSLRVSKHRDVTENLRNRRRSDADQSNIWNDISAKASRMEVASGTMAMADIFEKKAPDPEMRRQTFIVAANQVGYLAFINDGFAGGDIFGSADVCRRKLEKLMRGYYLDSLDHGVAFDRVEVEEVFREVRAAEHHDFGTVGRGSEKRFEAMHVQGSWKEVDGWIPHLAILPKRVR